MQEIAKLRPEEPSASKQLKSDPLANQVESTPNQPRVKNHSWLWNFIDAIVRSLPDKPYIP